MGSHVALIVDDEPDIRELLKLTLERMGIECICAENLTNAKTLLNEKSFNLCLTDMRLPDGDGLDFVNYIQDEYPSVPVAVITAHGNVETAIQALKSGAFDFITKPVDLTSLRNIITSALNLSNSIGSTTKEFIGRSKATQEISQKISKLARNQAPLFISGESGVGKELVARLIHAQGPRAKNAFIPVNCGAIPHELMESEFFGHKKGSFTGATSNNQGLFQAADNGTLFLDEIADLPLHMQVKLLRVIQEKKIRPIGEQKEYPVNVRILSATHKNLSELVDAGSFRKDLYYRINVIELWIPPLRERKEDIPVLAEHILVKISQEYGFEKIKLSDEVNDLLVHHSFPGNVRELENILERAMVMCEGDQITPDNLEISQGDNNASESIRNDETVELDSYLLNVEKKAITDALEKAKWNKTKAAKLLGISFRALRYKLQKLDLN